MAMTKKAAAVSRINPSPAPLNSIVIARVHTAEGGVAQRLMREDDSTEIEAHAHAAHVPALVAGDRVIAQSVSNQWIVLARLRGAQEGPAVNMREEDGRLVIEASGALVLKCGAASVELTADGKIRVHGKRIVNVAEGPMRLQGSIIELN
jgi:hypothetical protein